MTTFTKVPRDLYRHVESQAGEILPVLTGRMRSARPTEQFDLNWPYLLSGHASKAAVVAGLYCGMVDPPEHAWKTAVQTYCPRAWKLLQDTNATFENLQTGRIDAVLRSDVAALANTELGGYGVFVVMDVPAMVADIVGTLGQIPTFG
ncbi:hypothetical protein SAMN05216266_1174 [Amycolatopsis marina]|uniref:Uncharacterized protein n=1 Tax=Amycolatopsis marina TaxID=490629 RepID=A0A1I1BU90_9PSEU|nr:hypothetical protein [Amycolatopsis marina]SFB53256.1 hypothetical protein SAMN05216266_1174 [Amycolatopsis marina]